MNRRSFLRRAGLISGGALLGQAGITSASAVEKAPIYADGPGAAGPHARDDRLGVAGVTWRVDTAQQLVALTFDDGPKPDWTGMALDICEHRKVPATFFLIGRHAERYPELVRRHIRDGHEVANHTWTHPDLATLAHAQAFDELVRTHELLTKLTGAAPRHFRPPYGHLGGASLMAAAQLGYDAILWNLQLHETVWDAAGNARYIVSETVPGSILLAHDVGPRSRLVGLQSLPAIIDGLRAAGYTFVTVSQLQAAAVPAQRAPRD